MESSKRNNFKKEIAVRQNNKKQKMLELKQKYENNEIFEKDLSDEEMQALIELYKEEEKNIDQDIAIRKMHIENMLKKMKKNDNFECGVNKN